MFNKDGKEIGFYIELYWKLRQENRVLFWIFFILNWVVIVVC